MGMNFEARIAALEESTPRGYRTYNPQGGVVIHSLLPAGDWFREALRVLHGPDCPARRRLIAQLEESSRSEGGDLLFQMLYAVYAPQEERHERHRHRR